MNYPSQVIAVKLKVKKPGMVFFTLRPIILYLKPFDEELNGRSGSVIANPGLITMKGKIQYYDLDYESLIKVINYNVKLTCKTYNKQNWQIEVNNADSVILYISAAISYQLKDSVFLRPNNEKFKGNPHPHSLLDKRIQTVCNKGYDLLLKELIEDYQSFFQ